MRRAPPGRGRRGCRGGRPRRPPARRDGRGTRRGWPRRRAAAQDVRARRERSGTFKEIHVIPAKAGIPASKKLGPRLRGGDLFQAFPGLQVLIELERFSGFSFLCTTATTAWIIATGSS